VTVLVLNQLVTDYVTNSGINNKSENELIVTFVTNFRFLEAERKRQLVTKLGTILHSPSHLEILEALCDRRAATILTLCRDYNLDKMTVGRSLSELRTMGLAFPTGKAIHLKNMGGPKPTLWAILGYDPQDVVNAIDRHSKAVTPLFSESDRVAQIILDEYFTPRHLKECNLRDITYYINKNNPGFPKPDFINNVCRTLDRRGVRVWR
jgi:hypothetical protein